MNVKVPVILIEYIYVKTCQPVVETSNGPAVLCRAIAVTVAGVGGFTPD